MIGVSGFFCERTPLKKNKLAGFVVGAVIAVVLRYACHICSGVFAFADYADLDTYDTAIAYSFAYNSFTLVDLAIDLAAGILLFSPAPSADRWTSRCQPTSGATLEGDDFEDEDDVYTHDGSSHEDDDSND